MMNFFLFFSMRSWEEKLVANGSLYIFQFFWQRQFRMFIFKMLLVGFWIWHLGLQKISQKHYGLFHLQYTRNRKNQVASSTRLVTIRIPYDIIMQNFLTFHESIRIYFYVPQYIYVPTRVCIYVLQYLIRATIIQLNHIRPHIVASEEW